MNSGRLTDREIQCLFLAGGIGLRDAEIADRLGISTKRVGNYLRDAYGKIGVRDRRRAYQQGVLAPGLQIPGEDRITRPLDRRRPAEDPGLEPLLDDRPWLARVWRAPPRGALARLGLIVAVAVTWILILGGSLAVLDRVFEVTDQLRPS